MTQKQTCGEALVRLLERRGVDTVFGIPGVHTLDLYRGLSNSPIQHVLVRHEQGAGFMADGLLGQQGTEPPRQRDDGLRVVGAELDDDGGDAAALEVAIGVHDREAAKSGCSGLDHGLLVGIRKCFAIPAADEQGVDGQAAGGLGLLVTTHNKTSYSFLRRVTT